MNMRLYMQYIKRICLISFVQVYSLSFAFASDYSEMCNSINENSLPLINIIVNYDALNTESFVNGESFFIDCSISIKRISGRFSSMAFITFLLCHLS